MRENKIDTFLKINKKYLALGLKSIDILIISQIEEFSRNKCECYMTNEQLSVLFGESGSTIKRSLDKLESMNIISRDTKFIRGNGKGTKQRILSLNGRKHWMVQNEPSSECKVQIQEMEGSKDDDGRFKNQECKVHNDPIKDKEKENKKITLKEKTEESVANAKKRMIEDLSNDEGDEICRRLKKGERYTDLAKEYNIDYISKHFKDEWENELKRRAYILNQEFERKQHEKEPYIDYARIYANSQHKKTDEEIEREREHEEAIAEIWNDIYVPDEPIDYSKIDPSKCESLRLLEEFRQNSDNSLDGAW